MVHQDNPALKQKGVDTDTEEYRINRAIKITKWSTAIPVGIVCLIVGFLICKITGA